MIGLIIVVILVPLIMLILLISISTRLSDQQELVKDLHHKLMDIEFQLKNNSVAPPVTPASKSPAPVHETPAEIIPAYKADTPPVAEVVEDTVPEAILSSLAAINPEEEQPAADVVADNVFMVQETPADPVPEKPDVIPPVLIPRPPQKPKADLEKYIGENIANKIGIAVLVLGIGFFIKYAIDKNWINEVGRVLIGVASGLVLIGIAHRIRERYRSFSSVLVGGGLAVLYFSVTFAFHEYHLLNQQLAFIMMLGITGMAVLLSLAYDRPELAILATLGGFAAPFLVSTGSNNYIALFTYLAILCVGMTALSWFKRWPVVNIIAMLGTLIIYGGWLLNGSVYNETSRFPYAHAFSFGTLFYFLFLCMQLINNLRLLNRFTALDFMLILGTNFLYFLAGLHILQQWSHENWKGVFVGGLGVLNLVLGLLFYRRQQVDRNFVLLLLGLAISFISLIAPVQLDGKEITLFWAIESVLLMWLFLRSGLKILRIAHFVLSVITVASLLLLWLENYIGWYESLPIIINKVFVTSLVVVISAIINYRLHRQALKSGITTYNTHITAFSFLCLALALGYLSGFLELQVQFTERLPGPELQATYSLLYTLAYALLTLYVCRKMAFAGNLLAVFTGIGTIAYLMAISPQVFSTIYLLKYGPRIFFLGHLAGTVLLLYLIYRLIMHVRSGKATLLSSNPSFFSWLLVTSVIAIASAELYQVLLWIGYGDGSEWEWWQNLYNKAGLSILWSICSFVLIWLGLKYRYQPLRIISLTLFTITLVKLFSFDIRNVPPGGKIAAFILLGVLLLIVSFMYQRLKAILIDEPGGGEDKTENKQ